MIISASRRTDIPRFYSVDLLSDLKTNTLTSINPFNPNQITRIDLRNVKQFVFWTRFCSDMNPVLDFLDSRSIKYYFLFTLNNYPLWLERNSPPLKETIQNFQTMSDRVGKENICWRYDPIILTASLNPEYHLEKVEKLTMKLHSYTEKVIISMYDPYAHTERRLKEVEKQLGKFLSIQEIKESSLFRKMHEMFIKYNIKSQCCADSRISTLSEINPGPCILDLDSSQIKKDPSQRNKCLCLKSKDIGTYNSCSNGCLYCYAVKKRHF